MNSTEKTYIGTYKVTKVFFKSRRREVIKRGLTLQEARDLVNSYPDSSTSLVCYSKQFYSDRYYK